MKERPILFSGPMVNAILAGTKTQTRRVVKPQPVANPLQPESLHFVDRKGRALAHMWEPWNIGHPRPGYEHCIQFCPYGQPGDQLWVRESFASVEVAGGGIGNYFIVYSDEWTKEYKGKPCGEPHPKKLRPSLLPCKIYPSIHMPRWASRITLEITGVRVEQLMEISEADAENEGTAHWVATQPMFYANAASAFEKLWDSINAKRAPWASNSWVWVVEFRRLDKEGA